MMPFDPFALPRNSFRRQVSQQYQQSESGPVTKSPFGNLPFSIAGGLRSGFAGPLGRGFGYGGGKRSPYARGAGPTGQFIQQAAPIPGQYLSSMQALAPEIERGARSAYGGYQGALDAFMQQLPGFQQTAASATGGGQEALNLARQYSQEAFSPLTGRAGYQEASRRALAPAREAAAARGMLEGGQAQAGEQQLLSDLAFQAMQNEQANQQAAISQLGAAGTNLAQLAQGQAGIAGMGPEAQGALFQAFPQLAQMIQGAREMPLGAAQQALGFLTSTQEPNMALLRMVLPTVAQESKSFGGGGSVGVRHLNHGLEH